MAEEKTFEADIVPSLVLAGVPGSGRRSLAASLVRCGVDHVDLTDGEVVPEVAEDAPPALGEARGPGLSVHILDAPGTGGDDPLAAESARRVLGRLLPGVQLLVWVSSWPDLPSEADLRFLRSLRDMAPSLPLAVVGTGCERAGDSLPGSGFDPEKGASATERAVGDWLKRLRAATDALSPRGVAGCACSAPDGTGGWNLEAVSDLLSGLLPVASRFSWQCRAVVAASRRKTAEKVVLGAAAVAGGIGAAPLPVADMPFIVSTQMSMLAALFRIYGRPLDLEAARSLVLAALSAVVGPLAFGAIAKIVPGLGSVAGAGVAAACTWAVGEVARSVLEDGGAFDVEDFGKAVRRCYRQRRDAVSSLLGR